MSFPRYPQYKDSGVDWRRAALQAAVRKLATFKVALRKGCP